jgi:lipopolysaccharide transport system permease protein
MLGETDIIITAGKGDRQYWRDLWAYRELLGFLTWRDISVRYKQAVFGIAWAVVRPLVSVFVFTFLFGRVAGLSSQGFPYGLYVLPAMLFWQLFSSGLVQATGSMVGNSSMISKIYFPRLLVPMSAFGTALVDLAVGMVLLLGAMVWYGAPFSWRLLGLPVVMALCLGMALGIGLWTAAVNVKYRDFGHLIPFVISLLMYVSPVGYGTASFPAALQPWAWLNPLDGILEGARWCVLGTAAPGLGLAVAFSAACTLAFLWAGLAYFRAVERGFADVI